MTIPSTDINDSWKPISHRLKGLARSITKAASESVLSVKAWRFSRMTNE